MRRSLRPLSLVAVFALALLCTACGSSNNKDKIEGKWKLVSAPGMEENQLKFLEAMGGALVFDFKSDGTVVAGLEMKNAEIQAALSKKGEQTSMTGKYKLLSGDDVEFSGLGGEKSGGNLFGKGDKSRVTVKIDGDNMTISGTDGSGSLVRVK